MSKIKGFFSKIFFQKQNVSEIKDETEALEREEELKNAARFAVMSAFESKNDLQKPKKNQKEKTNLSFEDEQENIKFENPRIKEIFDQYNEYFFTAFNIDKSNYSLNYDGKTLIVSVNDPDFAAELSKSNKLSLSYEHIFLRLVQKEFNNFECRVLLRAGDSFNQHEKNIANLANKLALKVKKTGRKVVIPAKSSYERSIIHKVVSKFAGLESKSIGPHRQRRLIIYPLDSSQRLNSKSKNKDAHE